MKNHNTIGVDLAKMLSMSAFYHPGKSYCKVKKLPGANSNNSWPIKNRPWSPLKPAPFRQGHNTDKNDALAVAEAANRPYRIIFGEFSWSSDLPLDKDIAHCISTYQTF
jgi:hypothetical protein